MNQEELQQLSVDELVDRVLDLQKANQQLQARLALSGRQDSRVGREGDDAAVIEESGGRDGARSPDLDEQLQRTSLLLQLSIEFRETLEPTVIVERMLHVMVSNLGITNASVVLIGLDGSVELAMSLRDGEAQQVTGMVTRAVLERGLAGWSLRHGRSVVLPDVSRDKRWIPYAEWQKDGSAIVLPIRQAQTTLGVLTIYHPEPNHFTSRDMLLMEGVAAQAGVALGASRRYLEESRRREQALALFAMSQFLTSERTYDDLAALLQEKSVSIFGVDYGVLFLTRDDNYAQVPISPPAELSQAINRPLLVQAAVASRKAWEQKSIVTEAEPAEHPDRTLMAVPLIHNGAVIGGVVLIRTSSEEVSFSANMWSILTTFTNVIAASCANMKLVKQLRRHTETLESLVEERTRLLQNSRDFLRLVFDNLPEGLVLIDTQEVVMAANNAFCYPIIGRHPRTIVNQSMPDLWVELEQRGDMHIEMHHPSSKLANLPGMQGGTMRVHCTNSIGQKRWYDVGRISVMDDEGEVEYYIERWLDVTRQQELEHHLLVQDQQHVLGHLSKRFFHDINVPLQGVLGNLRECRELSGLPSDVQGYMEQALDGLGRIEQTLNSLQALYQAPNTLWQDVDVKVLLREIGEMTADQFSHYQVVLRLELDEQTPAVYGQRDALRQVFLGILFNAQEAMPDGGTITVVSRLDRSERGGGAPLCYVSIQDTGVGMTTDQIATLFEPFGSRKTRGVGLGLYLSKQIIEQHTGQIEVSSTRNEGTLVEVYLPCVGDV